MTSTHDSYAGHAHQLMAGPRLVATLDRDPMLPGDEADPLDTLHALSVVGTGHEPLFDWLVNAAAVELHAAVAFISLVDENRLWFEAISGENHTAWAPRPGSLCEWVLYRGAFLQVPDLTTDPCFADGAMAAAGLVSYASAPILGVDGQPVGSLAVLDFWPRWLTRDERYRLEQLAELATGQLQLRQIRSRTSALDSNAELDELAGRRRSKRMAPPATFIEAAEADLDLSHGMLDRSWPTGQRRGPVPRRADIAAATVLSRLRLLGLSLVVVELAEPSPGRDMQPEGRRRIRRRSRRRPSVAPLRKGRST
jgi:hypothetical protein